MKKLILVIALLLCAIVGAGTVTETLNFRAATTHFMEGVTTQCLKVAFDNDVNDVTVNAGYVFGRLQRIVIDATGSDESYKVYLKDNVGVLWSKVNCTTASDPYSLPITMTNGTNVFTDVPVCGVCYVQIDDANDATMTDLDIYIYYER